jgi:sugar phosphate isomerase/epimerase
MAIGYAAVNHHHGQLMSRSISLAHLTVLSLPPPQMIEVAARTGYATVGLRLIAVTDTSPGYPLMTDKAMLRETKAAIARTGVGVLDIEFVKITPDIDVAALEPFIAAGAELGAKHVITAPYDPDLSRLADRLGAIADLARPYGLNAILEFFPWTVVPNLSTAVRVVNAAARPNTGILVDTLHFSRSDSSLAELKALPASMLPFAHVCDAAKDAPSTTEALLHTARSERLPPGDGGLDLKSILACLPSDLPIALEVPMDTLTHAVGPQEVALRCRQAAARLLDV